MRTVNYPQQARYEGGLGVAANQAGAVTQATNKSTGVSLDKLTGLITMNAANLAADTTVAFTLTNILLKANDYLMVQHVSGGTQAAYITTANVAADGSATINVHNATPGALAEAIVLKFLVLKAG